MADRSDRFGATVVRLTRSILNMRQAAVALGRVARRGSSSHSGMPGQRERSASREPRPATSLDTV